MLNDFQRFRNPSRLKQSIGLRERRKRLLHVEGMASHAQSFHLY
jgi:hypothetical protein